MIPRDDLKVTVFTTADAGTPARRQTSVVHLPTGITAYSSEKSLRASEEACIAEIERELERQSKSV